MADSNTFTPNVPGGFDPSDTGCGPMPQGGDTLQQEPGSARVVRNMHGHKAVENKIATQSKSTSVGGTGRGNGGGNKGWPR